MLQSDVNELELEHQIYLVYTQSVDVKQEIAGISNNITALFLQCVVPQNTVSSYQFQRSTRWVFQASVDLRNALELF